MEFRNLTPHEITIVDSNAKVVKAIPSEGIALRLKATTVPVETVSGVPLTRTVYGECADMPEEKEGTFLIVSQLILAAYPERKDLLVPAEMLRDEKGNIIGCQSLGLR
jgi:hypothetical protein